MTRHHQIVAPNVTRSALRATAYEVPDDVKANSPHAVSFPTEKEASHPPSKELEDADCSRERCGGGGHSSPANNSSPSCLSPSSSIYSSIHRDALLPFPAACQKDSFLIAFCYNTQQAEILQCEKDTDDYIQYIRHANCTGTGTTSIWRRIW